MQPHPRATLLTITKAANVLGVHPNTLRAWADQGRVRCLRVNERGDRRFLLEDLRAFLAESRTGETFGPDDGWKARLEAVAGLGARLGHHGGMDVLATSICRELCGLLLADGAWLYRVDGHGGIRALAAAYTDERTAARADTDGPDDWASVVRWVAHEGLAEHIPDADADVRTGRASGSVVTETDSLLVAPLPYQGRTIGVVVLSRVGTERFSTDELRYLEVLAAVVAGAMANADIADRLRAQEQTLDRQLRSQAELLRVTERILTTLDPAAVIAEMADSLAELIPVDTLAIYVHRPSEHALEPLLARGIGAAAVMARRLPDSGAVVSRVLAGGDARSVTRPGRPSGRLAGGGTSSAALIIAPLHGPDRVVGVLHLKRIGADARFDRRELDLVRLFAAHVSIALQNALAHRAVQLRAQTDALTALRNHGSFRDDLHTSIGAGRPFALLMLDLDDFKTYNDGHGHEAGNELLRAIAGAVAGVCRDSDRVYRYGGDEFCVLLPATTAAEARVVAERVRDAVRRARAGGNPTGVQCSIGIARWPDDGMGRDELLQAVDRALYTAKRAGRDRVATAGDASMRGTDGSNAEPPPTQLTGPSPPTPATPPATPPAPPTSPKRDGAAAPRTNLRRA